MKEWLKRITPKIKEKSNSGLKWLREFYLKLDRAAGGSLGVVRHALTNFTKARGSEAAAGLAYYALFSIFPMLLVMITIASRFLDKEEVRETVLNAVRSFIPISGTIINQNIDSVLEARGPIATIAVLALLWSATNMFEKIIINVNRAFPNNKSSGFFRNRGLALLVILLLVVLLVLSLSAGSLLNLLPKLGIIEAGRALFAFVKSGLVNWVLPLVLKFLLFLSIYHWFPHDAQLRFSAKWISALVAATFWELATRLLSWALESGFTNYKLVYGSLSSIVALLSWLYLSGVILFIGAHLAYAVDYHATHKQDLEQAADESKQVTKA